MYNPTSSAPVTSINGVNVQSILSGRSPGVLAANQHLGPYLPNCAPSDVDACQIAVDLTGFIPCTGRQSTVWPQCMKPAMAALYPLYVPSAPYISSTPFLFPYSLFAGAASVSQLDDNSIWEAHNWSMYLTMVHYCDRYGSAPSGANGWKEGNFVYCENDALSESERTKFCTEKEPWWVTTGRIVNELTFTDLCPFTASGASLETQ